MWGFTNLNFKLNLKVSAFYLEKQKSFIPKKIFFGRTANLHPKDGVSRLNFPEGFGKIIAKIDSEFRKCLSAQFFGNSYIPKCQTSFKQARKGFPPISANKNFLGIFWRKLLENFWECFWNSLGIVWQSLGSWLCQFSMFKISWSFIFSKSTIVYIFKDSWLLSQVLIFKISWLSIFWKSTVHLHIQNRPLFKFLKSADCLHFQSLLSITFSSLLIIYTFKSADCLHFQSQLMA